MTSILDNIPYYTTAKSRLKSWLVPEKLNFYKLRGALLAAIITVTIAEVDVYKMLQLNVRHGDSPSYTTDTLIIVISIMEALLGPFIAWYGVKSKRTTLITWLSILLAISLTWYAVPDINIIDKPENCQTSFIFTGYTSNSLTRLSILTISCIAFSLIRVVAFTHGAAHMDQHDPKHISLHYGTFVLSRVLPLVLADKIFATGIHYFTGSRMRGLVIGSFVSLYHITQALPLDNISAKGSLNTESETESKDTDVIEEDTGESEEKDNLETESPGITESETSTELVERDFYSSLKRVLGNKLVMYHAVAMGLMAAALWGFGFNNDEIIKIKYLMDPRSNYEVTTELIRYAFVVIVVLYAGTFFYPPILLNEFLKKANKVAIIMSGLACLIYYIMVSTGDCPKGIVGGFGADGYNPVGCGLEECKPSWREFSPVCIPDSLLTLLSPREAGCVIQHDINGLTVFAKCACSGTSLHSIATVGACSDFACSPFYQLHLMLFVAVIICTIISLQSQGILVLRAVNPADKSIAIGVASSVVTICTFVAAHLAYNYIRENTCLWFEDERCHLQNETFPIFVGYTSAGLALLSAACSFLGWKARDQTNEQDTKDSDEKKTK